MSVGTELIAGVVSELAPGLRRVIAPNAGVMTGPGTNTYLLGIEEIAVLDPGPAMLPHIEAIQAAAGGTIRHVLVTHTHPDHSPAAELLAAATGAELIGRPAPPGRHQDMSFKPHRVPRDGELLQFAEFALTALATPGHASNHVCYLQTGNNYLFTGDHVIDGSTVVIDPPDGDMSAYLSSLERLQDLPIAAILPGHGDRLDDPCAAIGWIIEHRLQREAVIFRTLAENPGLTSQALVPLVYRDVKRELHALAERSLLAHLLKLQQDARAEVTGERWRVASADGG